MISLLKKKKKTPQQGTLPLFSHALYIYVYICVGVLFSYQLLLVPGTMCNSPRTQPSPPLPPALPLPPPLPPPPTPGHRHCSSLKLPLSA